MSIILGDSFAYPSNLFTSSRDPNGTITLVAEASTLRYDLPRQIYDDACDVGIAIRSDRTGRIVRFYLTGEDTDGEDVAGWRFEPIAEDTRRVPGSGRTRVLIIND